MIREIGTAAASLESSNTLHRKTMSGPTVIINGATGGAHNRLEINTFVKNDKFFSLYVQALRMSRNLCCDPYSDALLFFKSSCTPKSRRVTSAPFSKSGVFMACHTCPGTTQLVPLSTPVHNGEDTAHMARCCSQPGIDPMLCSLK